MNRSRLGVLWLLAAGCTCGTFDPNTTRISVGGYSARNWNDVREQIIQRRIGLLSWLDVVVPQPQVRAALAGANDSAAATKGLGTFIAERSHALDDPSNPAAA